MALVTTQNLGRSFGGLDVFTGLSLTVPRGARIAVVGPNGIGKTTLLRIIAGEEVPSAGEVRRLKGLTIGYLPQEAVVQSEKTLWGEALTAFADLLAQREELTRLEAEMAAKAKPGKHTSGGEPDGDRAGREAQATLERYGALQERFEQAGGYTYETRIHQVLSGLGFSAEEHNQPLAHLSGGQRTRALLARLLLASPDLLILDEPTNHLDMAGVEWLENYIKDWNGAILVVSHDRYLLDRVCNNVWEMNMVGVETYRGNYSHYLKQRQERWELRSKEFEAEKARLLKEMDYIKRNIAAQNVAQARGRLKRLSRKVQAIEQIGLEAMRGKSWLRISQDVQITTGVMTVEEAERRLKALKNPIQRPRQLKFKLRTGQRGGNIVLQTHELMVGYPDKRLFTVPDIDLTRQGCAALIGPNGSGKTTFLKSILGRLAPLAGEVRLGTKLDIGYFAQAHEDLNAGNTLIEEIESVAPRMLTGEIRSYLARYLFTGEDVFKRVSVLSGGERGRLALAKLGLKHANLLLLDEPTNHLDIPSQEVLQNVLADFDGTIILVSHDRYLINALATQIWEIDKDAGQLKVFDGSYGEYRSRGEATGQPEVEPDRPRMSKREAYRRARAAKNREIALKRRREARLNEVSKRMAELEERLADFHRQLANPPADRGKVHDLAEEYMRTEAELEAVMEEWDKLNRGEAES
jgi:ATP-binding cassette subfamily F protein 3